MDLGREALDASAWFRNRAGRRCPAARERPTPAPGDLRATEAVQGPFGPQSEGKQGRPGQVGPAGTPAFTREAPQAPRAAGRVGRAGSEAGGGRPGTHRRPQCWPPPRGQRVRTQMSPPRGPRGEREPWRGSPPPFWTGHGAWQEDQVRWR